MTGGNGSSVSITGEDGLSARSACAIGMLTAVLPVPLKDNVDIVLELRLFSSPSCPFNDSHSLIKVRRSPALTAPRL